MLQLSDGGLTILPPSSLRPAPAPVDDAGAAAADPHLTRGNARRQQFGITGGSPGKVEAILNQMRSDELFRECRQGDVTMQRWWARLDSTGARLREALGLLCH